jgi:uncharacterized protein
MNPVVHFEIPYDNQDKAIEFYKKVFGWNIEAVPNMPYHFVHTDETDKETGMLKEKNRINGGMYKRESNLPSSPVLVIDVPNIDERLEKVKANGGTLFREKTRVGEMGFYAQVKDTEGNIIGIWEMNKKE